MHAFKKQSKENVGVKSVEASFCLHIFVIEKMMTIVVQEFFGQIPCIF
jgi:hypothetical protein